MPLISSAIHDLANRWQTVDPRFGRPDAPPVELDLGCGTGGFTLAVARRHPERLILGAEVQLGRLLRLQNVVRQGSLRNVELMHVNNLELIGFMLPDASVRRLHLLCPDPWPKARHRSKRLATSAFFTQVARVLEPGGVLHLATDHAPYLEAQQAVVEGLPFFRAAPEAIADLAGIETDFERKWKAQGKPVPHLAYVRLAETPS